MDRSDILILGGGLVGLTLAIALDRHGISTIVVDPADPATVLGQGFDGRASAISSASYRMFEAIGVADRLTGHGCPIGAIRVTDGLQPKGLMFEPDADDGALGIMFENRRLRTVLHELSAEAPNITIRRTTAKHVVRDEAGVRVTLADGGEVGAALLVGAEGRRSPTRDAAGIRTAAWKYDHVAIITSLGHEKPHGGIAHEIFYPAGPFAILPLIDDAEGHRSALVWTVKAADAPAILGLPDRAFLAEAEARMGGLLGALRMASGRSSYPLGFHHAARITDRRLALVGDAAHGIHPIAGQGLNLGLRDAAALTEVLADGARLGLDLGDAQLLARYDRWRAVDSFLVAAVTDSLTHLFGMPGRLPAAVRRFGLGVVRRAPPLKAAFMAEARGESGAMPRLLRGELV
ncbi:FAD-dependent oxidoreductase [Sphingomonas naphthae]|uniref:FAD-dependent oxidoreductase n=1 Tax=Sphingomonas naphthae TaxID=1813468 RepID=A0ABY7TK30_9SPHN|nr:FAD-dependent monooxygenase [Sphingomonas naphthae]WCT73305.1 FAD-dependent oxidoreductase [Sphingomonas naphthae]